jgi:hypothetical protein
LNSSQEVRFLSITVSNAIVSSISSIALIKRSILNDKGKEERSLTSALCPPVLSYSVAAKAS